MTFICSSITANTGRSHMFKASVGCKVRLHPKELPQPTNINKYFKMCSLKAWLPPYDTMQSWQDLETLK